MPGPDAFMTSPSERGGNSSGYTTSAEGDGVGTELTKKGTIRQKRWTTRGRTGCLTCRARHVKCDEEKPACRRCISGRRQCRGYDFVSADAVPVVLGSNSRKARIEEDMAVQILVHQVLARRRQLEPEPPDWETMEAARYYAVCVMPSCEDQLITPFIGLPPCHGPNRPVFLLDVSSHRIASTYKARGRLVKAGEDPSLDAAWATHSRQMVEILGFVNKGIRDDTKYAERQAVLRRICTLLVFDLTVDAAAWRPHLLGYLAFVQHMGGVRALMRQMNNHLNSTQWSIYIFALAANTTSPADKQLRGFEAYTDEDLDIISSSRPNPDMPYPITLIKLLKHLTQLRAQVADGSCAQPELELAAQELFDKINAFDMDEWLEKVDFVPEAIGSNLEAVSSFAHIFQVAVRLYGILTLPSSTIVAWAVATGCSRLPRLSMYQTVRTVHRRELLTLLYPYKGTFKNALTLAWPVVVAGVSLGGDGSTADRNFIDATLFDMWQSPLARCGPILCLDKLRPFWDSGKTAWDDCFDEPVPPLA